MIRRVNQYFDNIKYYRQLMWLSMAAIAHKLIIVLVVLVIAFILQEHVTGIVKDIPPQGSRDLVMSLVISPLIETLITQYFIVWLLLQASVFRKYPLLIIILCTVVFILMHSSSTKMVNAAFSGIVLSYTCYYYMIKGRYSRAYWTTVFLHFLHNITGLTLAKLFIW